MCSGSLPVILSLLGLWVILFLFFAILYVEVFSMTKWNTGENRNQNYSSMANALVMLAFMTTGWVISSWCHDWLAHLPVEKDGMSTCTTCECSRLMSFQCVCLTLSPALWTTPAVRLRHPGRPTAAACTGPSFSSSLGTY